MFIIFFVIVAGVALPFRSFFDRIFTGDAPRNTGSCRKTINKLIGTSLDRDERQRDYSRDMLIFNFPGLIILLILLFLQGFLLFNSQNFMIFDLYFAINTAIRFVNSTNWQFYSGEAAVSYLIHDGLFYSPELPFFSCRHLHINCSDARNNPPVYRSNR